MQECEGFFLWGEMPQFLSTSMKYLLNQYLRQVNKNTYICKESHQFCQQTNTNKTRIFLSVLKATSWNT
jgi:hypothetical protein